MGESRVVKGPVDDPALQSTGTCPTLLSPPGFSEFGGTWKSWKVQIKGSGQSRESEQPPTRGVQVLYSKARQDSFSPGSCPWWGQTWFTEAQLL